MESILKAATYSTAHFAYAMTVGTLTDSLFAQLAQKLDTQVLPPVPKSDASVETIVYTDTIDMLVAAVECAAQMMILGGFTAAWTYMWNDIDDPTVGVPFILSLWVSSPHFIEKAGLVVFSARDLFGLAEKAIWPDKKKEPTIAPPKNKDTTAPRGTQHGTEA
jgi:hypothetical protein